METRELISLASETRDRVKKILDGELQSYDPVLHLWAADVFAQLPDYFPGIGEKLLEEVNNSLVNILCCDNDIWDTTLTTFADGLVGLQEAMACTINETQA